MGVKIPRWSLLLAGPLAAGLLMLGLGAGCQSYDFQPVQPLAIAQKTQQKTLTAHQLKPDLMLLVDTSGSMLLPADPSDPDCAEPEPDGGTTTCGTRADQPCNTSICPTRWSELKGAMNGFLTNSGTVARMGAIFFPSDDVSAGACGPSTQIAVPLTTSNDVDSELQATADQIETKLAAVAPQGGTPTNLSLGFLGTQYATVDTTNRSNFALLLTDGLPNCNPDNPHDYTVDKTTCECTLCADPASDPSCDSACGYYGKQGCLDQDGTVTAVTALASQGIKTIVVGFGADATTGDAPQVLSAVALAGGFPRACPNGTDAECGTGDTCDTSTHVCNIPYYQASNGDELAAALAAISASIGGNPCVFQLDSPPADPALITVLIDGQETPPGADTWSYDAGPGQVVFQGALCTKIQNSSPNEPVDVQIRTMQTL